MIMILITSISSRVCVQSTHMVRAHGGAVCSGTKLQAAQSRWFDSRWCPSGRTMDLRSTQSVTEMTTRIIYWGVKAAGVYSWQPYQFHVPIVLKSGSLNLLEPSGIVQGLFTKAYGKLRTEFDTVVVYYVILRYVGIWTFSAGGRKRAGALS